MKKASANFPFLKTKMIYVVSAMLASTVALFIYILFNQGFSWLALLLLMPSPIIAYSIWKTTKVNLDVLERMENVLKLTNNGEIGRSVV